MNYRRIGWVFALSLVIFVGGAKAGTCPTEPPLQNWTGGGATACPCFIEGELAGVVLDLPAEVFPIEILKVRIAWGSLFDEAEGSYGTDSAGNERPKGTSQCKTQFTAACK